MLFNKQQLPFNGASISTSLVSSVNIKEPDISNILKSLDINKSHGHNDISVRMLKLSHKSISKPLKLLSENCPWNGIFSDQ